MSNLKRLFCKAAIVATLAGTATVDGVLLNSGIGVDADCAFAATVLGVEISAFFALCMPSKEKAALKSNKPKSLKI
ncbi:MAG: hypothetical protein K8R48_04520 [Alphaproteobacteria bacterium]|nr:hypothetical protein [Alphaproteobacteria bacterium]